MFSACGPPLPVYRHERRRRPTTAPPRPCGGRLPGAVGDAPVGPTSGHGADGAPSARTRRSRPRVHRRASVHRVSVCGFFYLEVRVRGLLPGLRALKTDPLAPQEPANPFIGVVGEHPELPDQVGAKLGHRPMRIGQSQVCRPGQRDLDHLADLFAGEPRRPAFGIGGVFKTIEPTLIEVFDPIIDPGEVHSGAFGDLRGGPAAPRNIDHAVALIDACRNCLIPELLPEQVFFPRSELTQVDRRLSSHGPSLQDGPRYEE